MERLQTNPEKVMHVPPKAWKLRITCPDTSGAFYNFYFSYCFGEQEEQGEPETMRYNFILEKPENSTFTLFFASIPF